jgi:hypothetical protein
LIQIYIEPAPSPRRNGKSNHHSTPLLVMDENNVVNWATPLVNPMAVASRSLTKFPAFPASNAIDRNSLTRSEADAEDGVQQWWEVDLGEAHTVGEVCIENV